jgi:hypothetical protein
MWMEEPGWLSRYSDGLRAGRVQMGPTRPPTKWVPGSLPLGVKQARREVDYSSPSSAEGKNGGAILPLPHTSAWRDA